jgi:hypothetical protein
MSQSVKTQGQESFAITGLPSASSLAATSPPAGTGLVVRRAVPVAASLGLGARGVRDAEGRGVVDPAFPEEEEVRVPAADVLAVEVAEDHRQDEAVAAPGRAGPVSGCSESVQVKPGSTVQAVEQPSPGTWLPSSQASPSSTLPSPQAVVQAWVSAPVRQEGSWVQVFEQPCASP